ncbi:CRTAC1 family protein [Thermostilla marina]
MRRPGLWIGLTLLVLVGSGCRRSPSSPAESRRAEGDGPIVMVDRTADTGIDFVHTDGSSGRRYIIEPMSAGLALLDYDGDGRVDIYFLNGAPLEGYRYDPRNPPRNRLYRNLGNWKFEDVTEQAGVGDTGYGLGVATVDFDNDGDTDIYLNNYGPNVLYRNNGDGTFTDVTTSAGVADGNYVGAGALFLDIENDGDLDLYVGNYLEFDPSMDVDRMVDGMAHYPSPRDYLPIPDALFRNEGNGTFTDISVASGVAAVAGTAMGMIATDFDNDGDVDVFVLNDVAENFLFVNDGAGHFSEEGVVRGVAYNAYGEENASMGVDAADCDNDGLLDFYMTSYQDELPVYYHNTGDGFFEDVTHLTGAGENLYPHVNWGVGLVDFDNDGDVDIFVANGHTEDNIELSSKMTSWRVRNQILLNDGTGHFADVTDRAGPGMQSVYSSRGTAFDDLDNDGDIDAVIQNSREAPTILENVSRNENHFLFLSLVGRESNRDGVGAHVTVVTGKRRQLRERHAGRGYQSSYGDRLHFGLGEAAIADAIEIRWPSGTVDRLENVPADQWIRIVEGTGEYTTVPLRN